MAVGIAEFGCNGGRMAPTLQLTQGRAMVVFGSPLGGVCGEGAANPSSGGPVVFATRYGRRRRPWLMPVVEVCEVSTVVLIPKYTQWDRRIFVTSRGTSGGKDFSREILHHMRLPAISPIPH